MNEDLRNDDNDRGVFESNTDSFAAVDDKDGKAVESERSDQSVRKISSCDVVLPVLSDEQLKKEARTTSVRRPLVVALIGLFLSPFFGAGVFFSAFAFFFALTKRSEKKSVAIDWALIVSLTGVLLNVCVFVLFISFYRNNPPLPVVIASAGY